MIGEIGQQIMDVALTGAKIRATEAVNKNHPTLMGKARKDAIQAEINDSGWQVGGNKRHIVESGTALIQGLVNGDVNKAVANASAPYIANYIGQQVKDDKANVAAHGIANVTLVLAKGENAGAQSLGAMTAEAVGMLSKELYGKDPSKLTEDEKATVSAFASLAAGIAGSLVGGDTSSAANASQAGKTTVENNAVALPSPFGPLPVPVFPGINDADANKKMALALDNALKNIGKSINDFINAEGEVNIAEVKAALSPEQQKQFDILWERNALTVNQPPVTMESLAKQAGFGQAFVRGARETKDQNGNTVYIMDNGGAGSQIRRGDIVKFVDEFIFVYSKEGIFQAALNADGTKNITASKNSQGRELNVSGIFADSHSSGNNDSSKPNIGKGLTTEQKNELGGSSSGAPGGWEPQDEENARNRELQQKRFDELSKIYDKNSPSQDITIDGQTIRQGIGGNRYSTRVYESQNLTDQQIYNYAEQLAAQPLTKVKDGIYTAKLADGTMITLRSVSSSAEQTGARWTIQIRNSPTLKQVENGLGKNAEIKFR
ncbi:TPA: VENN motif pre-toxin domain-containing protein [Providencia stuartii]|uniref:VENN motif pre-toxin domain-containing protein n=1 Tax=Providencia stuartii TaxID=588 RepID=UPI0021555C78|nr:VENN motif pre-toxin domain-containing protein [Providencia stuartii]